MASLPCPPDLWARFSTLLDTAMDLPVPERARWLDHLAGDDITLKPWLARVLASDASMETGFLTHPPDVAADTPFTPGALIGPYRLESRLGEGGMGEVWRASRGDEGPRREVALKLPHAELLGGPFRQRFARERDVLAALSHPHIAQIYDAGLSGDGHPYLALELVEGEPITTACRATHATLHRRVELVCQVLDALTFAHQRLIVHRDIKPSNVLVTPEGGVKLLDFGIAKLLRPDGADAVPLTQPAGCLATPGYAAPEQLGDGTITVATDIFAVGVLLFELCNGHRPFARVPSAPDAPPAPLASSKADPAVSGAPEGGLLPRLLRGDMDAVIAQALALDPAARYGSAEAFVRDLQNWLDGRPVSARRIGWTTRGKKFVLRNKVGMGLAAVLALTVMLGTAGVAWQAARATREAAHARREADRATAIKDFLLGLFQRADPRNGAAIKSMTAKQLLDTGVDRADAAFAKQPETEIDLLASLGAIYEPIDIQRSVSVRKRRLALARKLYGVDDPRVVEDTIELSATLSLQKDVPEAAALLEDIRAPLLAHFGPASHQRAEWLMAHAYTVRAQRHGAALAEADDLAAIDILDKHFPGSTEYPQALQDLATNQYVREEFAADLANTEKMRQVEIATHTYDSIEALQYGNDIAAALENVGQASAADAAYQAQLDRAEKLVGKDSPYYRYALIHRAELLHMRGDRAQADKLFETADVLLTRPGSPSHTTLNRLYGNGLLREGRAADAISRLQDALAASRASKSAYITRVYDDEQSLGEAYAAVGRAADARKLLSDARADWMDELGPASLHALAAREAWARFLLSQGDETGAIAEWNAMLAAAAGKASAPAALAAADLALLAVRRGDTAQADALSARALTWIDATTVEYDARNRIDIWLARAETLFAEKQPAAARALAQQAFTAAEQYDAPSSAQLAHARDILAQHP
jgi:serine/threonine-protein kinase